MSESPWEKLRRAAATASRQVGDAVKDAVHAVRTHDPDAAMHAELLSEFVVDTGRASERVARVAARIDAVRERPPLPSPTVLGLTVPTAFTTPSGRIYVARALVELLPEDAAVAFVVGHEVAHHDLGHLSLPADVARAIGGVPLAARAVLVGQHALSVWARPEQELAADRLGLELCVRAGYGHRGAIAALRAVERWALDHRAVDVVFGHPVDPDVPLSRLTEWFRQRRRGYVPLRDRLDHLRALSAP